MSQTSPKEKPGVGVVLPPKLGYQRTHKRERNVEAAAQHSEPDEEEEYLEQHTVSKQGPKQVTNAARFNGLCISSARGSK